MQGSKPQKPRLKKAKTTYCGTATKKSGSMAEQGWDGRRQMKSGKNLGFGST